jgi:hypothetical protein
MSTICEFCEEYLNTFEFVITGSAQFKEFYDFFTNHLVNGNINYHRITDLISIDLLI